MNSNKSESVSIYQQYLPSILQEDVFVGQFLRAFEKILSGLNETPSQEKIITAQSKNVPGLEEIIDNIELYFNPQQTPEEFLPWLAGWVALSLRDDWQVEVKRAFIRQIVGLYYKRGTKAGLIEILKIYLKNAGFGETVEVFDRFDNFPNYFQVQLTLNDRDPDKYWRQAKIAQAIIDREKPAQTFYSLKILIPTMQLTTRSQPDEVTIINQTVTAEAEMPLVSPQAISEELESREKLSLQAQSSDAQTTSVNPSQTNSHPRSQSNKDEENVTNQNVSSSSEIPVVSSQILSEKLTKNEEMSLVHGLTNTVQRPLPIIQAKQQNSSHSPSSFSIVNPSDTLVTPKSTQQDNYDPEKSSSINYKKSNGELPAQEFPIVTVQPLTSPINLTKEEVRNKPNYQNQLFNISKSQINQNKSHQNIDPLPIVPVTSQINFSSQTRSSPLPLANNSSVSNSISQKTNQANQNSRGSNTADATSSPRIFASSSPPTQTFVSAMETQPKIDLDAITSQVEKKIMRRLVIESERRGKIR